MRLLVQALLHPAEVRLGLVHHAEMRQRQARRPARGHEVDRAVPGLDVDVGGRRRRTDQVRRRDPHAGHVSDVGRSVSGVEVHDVVGCMARRVLDVELSAVDRESLASFERVHVGLGHRQDSSPQRLHLIAVYPLGAPQKPRRVDQVWGATSVHIHRELRKALHERAGRTRVIEVDMRQQQGPGLRGQAGEQGFHPALGTRIDDRPPQVPGADHPLAASLEHVDQSWRPGHGPKAIGGGSPLNCSCELS